VNITFTFTVQGKLFISSEEYPAGSGAHKTNYSVGVGASFPEG
jgi:hypothetical protein